MKYAFLTETKYRGKWPENHPNCRTEIAWQITLNSDHYNIHDYESVKGYDAVFIIFPKSTVTLNAIGIEMMVPGGIDNDMSIYEKPIIEVLKNNNKKVCFIQEGPHDLFENYRIDYQFHYYNKLSDCDIIFAHNSYDVSFYKGLFPGKIVNVIPTLMIDPKMPELFPKQNKVMISGNFAPWYGGFKSYMVASTFNCPICVPSSHCKRNGEELVPNLKHLPWVNWTQWMRELSTYKYAVSMMPTVAAGTFSMNCSYWGIPCIGNQNVETQSLLFPFLSVDINDVEKAIELSKKLIEDSNFYDMNSKLSTTILKESMHFDQKLWMNHIEDVIKS